MQRKIEHINLMVPDMEVALEYYTKILGFEILGRYQKGAKRFAFLTDGNETFEFLENKELEAASMNHIAYESKDIEADYKCFKELDKNILLTEIGFVDFLFDAGMYYFFIKGASGERIEFCQRVKK